MTVKVHVGLGKTVTSRQIQAIANVLTAAELSLEPGENRLLSVELSDGRTIWFLLHSEAVSSTECIYDISPYEEFVGQVKDDLPIRISEAGFSQRFIPVEKERPVILQGTRSVADIRIRSPTNKKMKQTHYVKHQCKSFLALAWKGGL